MSVAVAVQTFDGDMFRCGDARQRLSDGRWLPCADPACRVGPISGRYLVVPISEPLGFREAVFVRRLVQAPAPDQRWEWEAAS